MADLKTAKYIRTGVTLPSNHPEFTPPPLYLISDKEYGNYNFRMHWECIKGPFEMVPDLMFATDYKQIKT